MDVLGAFDKHEASNVSHGNVHYIKDHRQLDAECLLGGPEFDGCDQFLGYNRFVTGFCLLGTL